jgi:hypothetical protein
MLMEDGRSDIPGKLVFRYRSLLVCGASWVLLLGWRDSY